MYTEKYQNFYKSLRSKIERWVSKNKLSKYLAILLTVPDVFYLLINLMMDKRVPHKYRVTLTTVTLYFISPIDILPEGIIGPIGYLDDVVLAVTVLSTILPELPKVIIHKYWMGEEEIYQTFENVLEAGRHVIDVGLWKYLGNIFKKGN